MYTAYVLTDETREMLLSKFSPKYNDVIAHHITIEFGVQKDTPTPAEPTSVKVIGYVDDPEGIEALVVSVNGSKTRPDGKVYHITLSLDREKFTPKDSNDLIEANKRFKLIRSIPIAVTPEVLK